MTEQIQYLWKVSMKVKGEWITELRIYYGPKSKDDFDLYDIPNKRKNATLIGIKNQ